MRHTILAAVDVSFEEADRMHVVALAPALEALSTAGLWAYSRPTLGFATSRRFWEEVL